MLKTLPGQIRRRSGTVTAVAHNGLSIAIKGEVRDFPWSCVGGISAGCLAVGGIIHLALAVDIDIDAAERVLVITEADRIWAAFTQILPNVFPDVPNVTAWGPSALVSRAPLSLYDRPHEERGRTGLDRARLH